mgnify:CR=1 FL=1
MFEVFGLESGDLRTGPVHHLDASRAVNHQDDGIDCVVQRFVEAAALLKQRLRATVSHGRGHQMGDRLRHIDRIDFIIDRSFRGDQIVTCFSLMAKLGGTTGVGNSPS